MKEFMFYIQNEKDGKKSMTPEDHLAFVQRCEAYIGRLQSQHALIAAQPILPDGVVIRKSEEGWTETPLPLDEKIQVGYYHIRAENFADAIQIAKDNPEFEYVPGAIIEIRQIKTKERETGFVYPAQ